jgi:hypothetical protein
MRTLVGNTGGRPVRNDDIFTLQQEVYAAIYGPYGNRGAFIVNGCEVSGPAGAYRVTAGIVCLDGTFARFGGASNVALPMQLERDTSMPSFQELRPYKTGGVQVCLREYTAHLVPATGFNGREFLTLTAAGGKRWEHMVQAATRTIGETQELVLPSSYVPANYDAVTGAGLPGTEAWGWAMLDGRGGRPDLRGRATVVLDLTRAAYDAVGDTGGEETVTLGLPQIPVHNHTDGNGGYTKLLKMSSGGNDTPQTDTSGPQELAVVTGGDIQSVGGGQAHNNMMPFYTVLKRVWIGFGS